MHASYLQVFSLTDHTEALQGRYQGPYTGLNATIATSEIEQNSLKIATAARGAKGELDHEAIMAARLIVAYRHSDTGVLQGTSESLITIATLPWTELPGFEVLRAVEKEALVLRLWNQEMTIPLDRVVRVRFMKTMVYLRNFGVVDNVLWTEEALTHGPTSLHAEEIDQDLTLAPPGSSGIQIKMGQETTQ